MIMIFDGFYLQQLKVGIQFCSQRSRPGCTVKASNPTIRPVVSCKTLTLGFGEKSSHKDRK